MEKIKMLEPYFDREALKKVGYTDAQIDEVVLHNANYISEHFLTVSDLKIYFETQANFEKLRLKNLKGGKIAAGDSLEIWSNNGYIFYNNAFIEKCLWNNSGLAYCECANVHTDNNISYFSASGGALVTEFNPNDCKLIGTRERLIWTWGSGGARGNGGLYIPVKANLYKLIRNEKFIPYVIKLNNNKDFGYKYKVEGWDKKAFTADETCMCTMTGIKKWLKNRNLKIGKKINHYTHEIIGDVDKCMLMSKKEYDDIRGNLKEFPILSCGSYTTAFLKNGIVYYCNPNVKDRTKLPYIYE